VLVVHSPVETEVAVVYDTVDGEKAYPLCKIPADPGCNEIQVYTLEGQESIGNIRYFKERYLAGKIEFEEIDDYVDEWNNSDDTRTLAQFLGLNEEEEDVWIDEGDDALYELLEQQKED